MVIAQIQLFDSMGRLIWRQASYFEAGLQQVAMQEALSDLQEGLYFYHVQINGQKLSGKFLK